MYATIRPSASKPKGFQLQGEQGTLKVNLGAPFNLLLNADSDADTPSPLSICFDIPKSAPSPLRATSTEWTDSDSDSEPESDSDVDDAQVIVILSDSPFYTPPSPPEFQTTFELPPLPPASFESDSVAAQFHAELGHILPEEVQKDLFLIDEESLRQMGDELFAAPMDAFIDVCLTRLRPPTPATQAPESEDASASCPTYYLASYLDPQRYADAVLAPAIRALFQKRTLSTCLQVGPAAARQITPFL
ncbi:hypothetical protein C8R46DRAFT_654177 [Mycena filopes]|nr:hypothetical protein C8R46DRAFT_654177 [Mycena filopes]